MASVKNAEKSNNEGKNQPLKGMSLAKKIPPDGLPQGKSKSAKQSISSGFQTEIVILVILIAASIILMVSCLGLWRQCGWKHQQGTDGSDGADGLCISIRYCLGLSVFLISNKSNVLAYKKTAAAAVLFLVLCGVFQLLTEGYAESTTLAEYYKVSSEYHTGGGAIGGAHLHFYHFRIWNGRSLCDHCACDL